MAEQDMINDLIARFRDLNLRVRGLPRERVTLKGSNGETIHHVLTRMRDNEVHFSQALKEAISGVPIPADLVRGHHETDIETETTDVILSEFGTARESTLAMLRTLTADEWERTPDGGASIRTRIKEHMTRSDRSMEQIIGLLGSP